METEENSERAGPIKLQLYRILREKHVLVNSFKQENK
jgi:hypothetical protein